MLPSRQVTGNPWRLSTAGGSTTNPVRRWPTIPGILIRRPGPVSRCSLASSGTGNRHTASAVVWLRATSGPAAITAARHRTHGSGAGHHTAGSAITPAIGPDHRT